MNKAIRLLRLFINGISEAFELYFIDAPSNNNYKYVKNTYKFQKL